MNSKMRSDFYRLTFRELDVIKVACAGAATPREIAERLCITEGTARSHLSAIYVRLGAASLAGVVLFALYDEGLRQECFPQIKEWADE
ncbi:MAG: response regulator transcription factor [Nitrospiraceae bacterium]